MYVTCRGQSLNQGSQGQFYYNTSAGNTLLHGPKVIQIFRVTVDANDQQYNVYKYNKKNFSGEPTLFVLDDGIVKLEPSLSHLHSTEMEVG